MRRYKRHSLDSRLQNAYRGWNLDLQNLESSYMWQNKHFSCSDNSVALHCHCIPVLGYLRISRELLIYKFLIMLSKSFFFAFCTIDIASLAVVLRLWFCITFSLCNAIIRLILIKGNVGRWRRKLTYNNALHMHVEVTWFSLHGDLLWSWSVVVNSVHYRFFFFLLNYHCPHFHRQLKRDMHFNFFYSQLDWNADVLYSNETYNEWSFYTS